MAQGRRGGGGLRTSGPCVFEVCPLTSVAQGRRGGAKDKRPHVFLRCVRSHPWRREAGGGPKDKRPHVFFEVCPLTSVHRGGGGGG